MWAGASCEKGETAESVSKGGRVIRSQEAGGVHNGGYGVDVFTKDELEAIH